MKSATRRNLPRGNSFDHSSHLPRLHLLNPFSASSQLPSRLSVHPISRSPDHPIFRFSPCLRVSAVNLLLQSGPNRYALTQIYQRISRSVDNAPHPRRRRDLTKITFITRTSFNTRTLAPVRRGESPRNQTVLTDCWLVQHANSRRRGLFTPPLILSLQSLSSVLPSY